MSTLAPLTTILLFSGFAVAQVSYPSCTVSALDWTYNSLSQNPCEVAAYLESTCWQGVFSLPALPSGYEYSGPYGNGDANSCKCNTITYSLLSACDACQGERWFTWSEWVTNCTTILPASIFPNPVPSQIYVPYWATLDTTLENSWNPNKSMSVGDSPEIGPGVLIGASSTSSSPTGSSTTSTGPTGSTTPTSGSGSSNTSAIVSGVVGAVATLVFVIIILGVFYLRRRRHANSGARMAIDEDATIASPSMPDPPITLTSGRTYNPTDPNSGMFRPEAKEAPCALDVSSQVVPGPYQGSGATPLLRPSEQSPPSMIASPLSTLDLRLLHLTSRGSHLSQK